MKTVHHFVSKQFLKKLFLFISLPLFLSLSAFSYHLDASLEEINKIILPAQRLNLKNPEFFIGEVVTTSNGAVVKDIFGETSEKQVLSNNVVEGAFYE